MARRKRTVKTVIVRQSQQQSRARVAPRRRRRVRQARNQMSGRQLTTQFAKSLSDPWSNSACVPDGANGVGCFSVKETFQVGTGAAGGAGALAINPQSVVNFAIVDTGSTSTTPTIAGNYAASVKYSTIAALYSDVRVISGGVKIRYVGNTQTDQGILLIGQVAGNVAPSSFSGVSITTAQAQFQNYKLFPLRSGGTVTWRPQCMDDVITYAPTNAATGPVTAAPSAPYLLALMYGGNAATASLFIADVVVNYEGQYKSQTFLPGGVDATPSKAEAGWYETALNAVRSIEPIMPFVSSTLTNAFNSPVASTAMGMLLGTAGRRGLPRLPGYMQVD